MSIVLLICITVSYTHLEADIKPIYDAVVSSAPDYDINVIKDRLDNM